ncbi:MAG: hypothetical protein Kow0090_02760 [Myxococcota bacterium]
MQEIKLITRLSILALSLVWVSPAFADSAPEGEGEVEELEEVEVKEVKRPARWDSALWAGSDAFPNIERGINLYNARTTKRNALLLLIDHRADQPFTENSWEDFLGLDAGSMKIGLGLRFGALETLDVGIYRLNGTKEIFDTYETDVRWRFLNQESAWLDAAVRVGGTWFFQPGIEDALAPLSQLLLSRTFFDRLLLSLNVMYHGDSSYETKTPADDDATLAVGGIVELRIFDFLALTGEAAGSVWGFGEKYPNWTGAAKFITNKHTFSIVVTNTQYISGDGIVSGSDRNFGRLVLGFNITREILF